MPPQDLWNLGSLGSTDLTSPTMLPASGMIAGQPSPMPATNPVQPQGGAAPPASGMDPAMMKLITDLAQSQMGQIQKLGGVAGSIGDIAGTMQQPVPKMGPQVGGVDAQGKPYSFLHNLGQALLMAGGMTGPGRDINEMIYGPNIRRYGAEQAQKAERIGALKGEAGALSEGIKGAGETESGLGMAAYRSGQLGLGAERNQIAAQKVAAYSQGVQNRLSIAIRGLDLNALRTGSQLELNKARTVLEQAMPDILRQRNELEAYGIDTRSETQQAVANTMSQLGIDKTHPIANVIDSLFGTSLTPSAPQTPGGAQPVKGPAKLPARGTSNPPAKKNAIGGVVKWGRDAQGNPVKLQ